MTAGIYGFRFWSGIFRFVLTGFSMLLGMKSAGTFQSIGSIARRLAGKLRSAREKIQKAGHLGEPPSATAADLADQLRRDAILTGDLGASSPVSANRDNIGQAKAGAGVLFSGSSRLTALPNLVGCVVSVGAEPKMVGIYATRHVAAVTDMHATRDSAVNLFPSPPMSPLVLSLATRQSVSAR